jgi:hypothetical protein
VWVEGEGSIGMRAVVEVVAGVAVVAAVTN